uniref:Replication factor C subunit 1 n=1 Tax=Elaeophora elaphi TaxID=1147741 RepID=A0A0R3RH33_9BILA
LQDIRRYFGGSAGKSALTEIRASKGSPKRTNTRPQVTRKKPNEKPLVTDIVLSDASDDENPLPRSLRKELHKKRAKKRILLSSDDDGDDLPPSASQIQPLKRGEKITLKKINSKPTETLLRRTAYTTADEESDEEEDIDEFVPAPPVKKKKRNRTPPGQGKLDFSRLDAVKKDSPRKKKINFAPEMEAINPAEFFRSFAKSSIERKQSTEQSGSTANKTKPPEKNVQVTVPPQASPSKSKQEIAPESKKGRKTVALNDEDCKSTELSARETKTKKSPKIASVSVKAAVKKNASVLKQEEGQMQGTKKRKEEHEERKQLKVRDDVTNKTTTTDISREKKVSRSRTAEQKSSKMTQILEKETSKLDKLVEIGSPTSEEAYLPWVDKYKPNSMKHLVGQNGEKSPMNKLLGWLRNWGKNHLGVSGKQKKARPPPWLAQNDGSAFKAVMLSGPPGVGKTTCAVMACKELKLRYVEKNASDVRNKKALEAQISEVIGCEQIEDYMKGSATRKMNASGEITHVLIMDEVDGMSGNDDRAGIAELIQIIKETLIPIICICNDRQSQKMRSLVNYCFDVRFQRPRVEQIRARLLTITCQEHLKVDKEVMDEIIEAAQHDVRQSIYNLQLLSSGVNGGEMQSKDAAVNPFEAARRLLSIDTPAWEKQQLFFIDPSIMPLFVQENYPFVQNSKMSASERLCALRKAANSISEGDIIDRIIRTTGAWTLLNEQALFSSVAPTSNMNGYMKGMINFPSWLGKNSTFNKRQRLLRQLTTHTYLRTFAASFPMVLDYVPVLRHSYCRSLLDRENDGVNDVINLYKEYNLVRDDIESVAELAVWPGMKDPGAAIPTKVKSALTRTLNKEHIILPYALDASTKGRKKLGGGIDLGLEIDEEGNLIEQVDDENDSEDSGGESDNDDNFAGVMKKKANSANENKKTRGGKADGFGSRGARSNRGASGRGRSNKK